MIFGLSKKGQELFHFLIKGLQEGKSGLQILKELRELGLGYRTQDFYNDLRIVKGEILKWETMKFVKRDAVISESLYTPSERAKTPFVTKVRVEIENVLTGERKEIYVSVTHDTPLKRRDIEEMAKYMISVNIPEYEKWDVWRYRVVTPVAGFRKVR